MRPEVDDVFLYLELHRRGLRRIRGTLTDLDLVVTT